MNKNKYKKVSIVIPSYNEGKTLPEVINRVLQSDTLGMEKEIIIIDDGSSDSTKEILSKIKNKKIKVTRNKTNKGKGYSMRKGFSLTNGDIVIVQDADLEYNPNQYKKLLRPIVNGKTNVVYGSRELSGKNVHSSIIFHAGGKLVTLVTNLLFNTNLTDEATGYKVFKTESLKSIKLKSNGFEFCSEITGLLLKNREKIVEVPITYLARHRHEGKKINFIDGIIAVWTLLKIRIIGHI